MYLFNSFIPGWPKNSDDDQIAKQMQIDWTNFAKTGDLAEFGWPKFSTTNTKAKDYQANISFINLNEEELFRTMEEFIKNNY